MLTSDSPRLSATWCVAACCIPSGLPTLGALIARPIPYDLILLVAGLVLLLMVWYLRGRRHSAVLRQFAPLLDVDPGEMQAAGPIRGGEDHVKGRYKGRDVLFALKEPDRGHEAPRFRVVLGSATNMPFLISVQKRMLFGIVSQIQRGRAVKTGDEGIDKNYYVTELTALTGRGLLQKLFDGSKTSMDLEDHLQKRLISWLRLPETLTRFETLFRSCGIDYLTTRIEYPGSIELQASESGLTVVLRHYSRRQTSPENVGRVLAEMEALLRSAESLLELKPASPREAGKL
jgi:hypothetical protein